MTLSDLAPVAVLIGGAVALTLALYRGTWTIQLQIAKEEAKYWQERYLESERFRDELTQAVLCETEAGPNGNKLDS